MRNKFRLHFTVLHYTLTEEIRNGARTARVGGPACMY